MTFSNGIQGATAIGAVLALTAMPVSAQMAGGVTASDLGVDLQYEAPEAQQAEAGEDTQSAQAGDGTSGDGLEPPRQPMVSEGDFTEEQLAAFVAAALDVREVRDNYAQQISTAEDEAAAQALVAEAQAEMVAAIENADDITLEEYSEIGNAAQEDPALAKRLTAMFRAELGLPEEGAEDQS